MAGRSGFHLVALTLVLLALDSTATAQQVRTEVQNGIEWRITEQKVRVPETTMQTQTRTVYRQQLTTDTHQSTHYVTVPVTQYRLVSRMHGRWNPFVTPYWTHHYEPVTTWTQQAATVSVPVNRLAWVPQQQTVQTPVTTYREAINESRVAVRSVPRGTSGGQQFASNASPSATLARTPATPRVATGIGGTQLENDPPASSSATGWQNQPLNSSQSYR